MTRHRHEIPTHLGVEDKAYFGLSVRQVMVLTIGCSGAYGLWNQWPDVTMSIRVGVAAVIVLAVFALGPLTQEMFTDTCANVKAEASMTATCDS